jgi:hypothetical protein
MRLQFSLQTLVFCAFICCLLLAWSIDHFSLLREIERVKRSSIGVRNPRDILLEVQTKKGIDRQIDSGEFSLSEKSNGAL